MKKFLESVFKKLNLVEVSGFKATFLIAVGVILALMVLKMALPIVAPFTSEFSQHMVLPIAPSSVSYSGVAPASGWGGSGGSTANYASDSYEVKQEMGPSLSARNIILPPQPAGGSPGTSAEKFESSEYSARIETGNAEKTCADVHALKAKDYVVFQNENTYRDGCSVSFKVKKANVDEILGLIKAMHPRDLSDNTYTIENQISDFTSTSDMLTAKLASIDQTLAKAISAYDSVTALAVSTKDADALAKVIDSKINIIERLTQERVSIQAQIDQVARQKTQQLDRVDYTFFSVTVSTVKYVDWQQIKDSWRGSLQQFANDINMLLQQVTIGLIVVCLVALQYILYILLAVIALKVVWRVVKNIWKA